MREEQLQPPREAWETARYEDDPFGLGEIDVSKLKIVSKDFLPPPDKLVFKNIRRKVTISLEQESIDFFKNEAKKQGVPYQRMIRNLLHSYVHSQREDSLSMPTHST